MPRVPLLLSVFAGGCAGGALRAALASSLGTTLAVNLAGCFLLGMLVVAAPHHWRPLLGTGFCGGFTTFGSVMVSGARHSFLYLALSLGLSVAFAGLGVAAGHGVSHRRELAPEDPDLEVD